MPRRRMDARVIREVLRLKSLNLSIRQIGKNRNPVALCFCLRYYLLLFKA